MIDERDDQVLRVSSKNLGASLMLLILAQLMVCVRDRLSLSQS